MVTFDSGSWMLLGLVALAGTTAVLWILAQTYTREQSVHELKVRVFELRRAYSRRLAEIASRDSAGGTDPKDGAPDEAGERRTETVTG